MRPYTEILRHEPRQKDSIFTETESLPALDQAEPLSAEFFDRFFLRIKTFQISPYVKRDLCPIAGSQISCVLSTIMLSALRNSASRAGRFAGAALQTKIRIDLVLAITLGDCTYRALTFAGTARETLITNYICHRIILLFEFLISLNTIFLSL